MCLRSASEAAGLEPGEEDERARVRRETADVMQHAPAGSHAASRQDHLGPLRLVQGLRLLGLVDDARDLGDGAAVGIGEAMLALRLEIYLRRVARHGTVEIDRQRRRDGARGLEAVQVEQQRLRAAHREAGHDDGAAARGRARDLPAQLVEPVGRVVQAIAIGRFEHQQVGAVDGLGRIHHRIVGPAQVPREGEDAPAHLHGDRGGPEDVARGTEARGDPRVNLERLVEGDRRELLERALRILPRVERQRRAVLRPAVAVRMLRLLLLQVGAVGQQDAAELVGRCGAADAAAEAAAHQQRQVAAVVDVGVGEQDRVQRCGRHRQRRPVAKPQLLEALEEPAIDQQRGSCPLHQVLRAGHRPRGAEELQPDHALPSTRVQLRPAALAW